MRIFPLRTVIVLCSVLLLVYLDVATLYYYFSLYYNYLELKSNNNMTVRLRTELQGHSSLGGRTKST